MDKIKPNTVITIVEKPDPNYYPDRLDVLVLRITRVGTKYVYGIINYLDYGVVKTYSWECKIDLSRIIRVFEGARWDLVEEANRYYENVRRWRDEYEKARREAYAKREWEAWQKAQEDVREWERLNPKPEPPEILLKDELAVEQLAKY